MDYFSFKKEDALKYGVNAALLLHNFKYWLDKNVANGSNIKDGRYWTYNSLTAIHELFPFLGITQIRGALKKLEDSGLLIKGNYNKHNYDRTVWFSLNLPHYKTTEASVKTTDADVQNDTTIPKYIQSTVQNTKSKESTYTGDSKIGLNYHNESVIELRKYGIE